MQHLEQHYQFAQYRGEELRRKAEQHRLAQEAAAQQQQPVYAPLLAGLGSTLTSIGTGLQQRYGDLGEMMEAPKVTTRPATPNGAQPC